MGDRLKDNEIKVKVRRLAGEISDRWMEEGDYDKPVTREELIALFSEAEYEREKNNQSLNVPLMVLRELLRPPSY